MRLLHLLAFLGLAACSTGAKHKPATGHHVSTGSSSPAATASLAHWEAMFRESVTSGDPQGAAQSLTIIAERWPGSVGQFSKPALYYAIRGASGDEEQYRLYRAFLATDAGRQAAGGGYLWREFALMQLQRGEGAAAAASLGFITYPDIVVSVNADKRFTQSARASRLRWTWTGRRNRKSKRRAAGSGCTRIGWNRPGSCSSL